MAEGIEARLAAALSRLPARQYLVLSAEGPASCSYYVQFAQGGPIGLLAEAVSNQYLLGYQPAGCRVPRLF